MAKKRNEEVDSGNATEKDANTIDDFVVQQPSLARMRSTKDSLVISRKLKLLEAPDVSGRWRIWCWGRYLRGQWWTWKRGEALNKHKFWKSDSCRVMYKLWKFCCKNVCSNLFFCFQIYPGYFTEVKEDTKMEMMKKLSMRRLKKRYKSSLATGWARLHSSEEFEFRRAIEGKAENEHGENGDEEFDEQLMMKT